MRDAITQSTLTKNKSQLLLSKSIYLPITIKKYIIDNNDTILYRTFIILNKKIKLYHSKELTEAAHLYIKSWLYIVISNTNNVCATILSIYLFLTPFKKCFPSEKEEITSQHVNSGVAYVCSQVSEIMIFREEEWFKVFLHETIHSFGLYTDIKNIIYENCSVKLFESYTEMLARIYNIMYIIYDNIPNIEHVEMLSLFELLFDMDRKFYHKQADIILTKTIYQNKIMRENTNVYAYYIITSIFANNINEYFAKSLKLQDYSIKYNEHNYNHNNIRDHVLSAKMTIF